MANDTDEPQAGGQTSQFSNAQNATSGERYVLKSTKSEDYFIWTGQEWIKLTTAPVNETKTPPDPENRAEWGEYKP